jgi:Cytochrome c554 and c-prime
MGAATCAKCHPAEFDLQSRSAHAHTLAPSAPGQPGDWAFGAGQQAITFVSRVDRDHYRELGQTWYRALNGYGLTPGHRNLEGISFRVFDPDARILRCFACHSTGPLTLGEDDRIVPHELGVRCEVCHGPGGLHARDPARNRPRNPARLPSAGMNAFCATCHRLTLETGEELTDLHDSRNSRSQPLRLAASTCFQRSKGRLTCLTCHSPHAPLERSAAAYDTACKNCHMAPRHTEPVAGQSCTKCHMPAIRAANLVFVNHRIAAYRAEDPLSPVSVKARQ